MTAASPGPIKVVMECSNSTSGLVHPPFQSTSTANTALPTTTNPPYPFSNTSRRHCPGLTSNNPAKSCRDILLCNSFLPSGYYWIERNNSYFEQSHILVRVYCYMKEDKCGVAGVMCVGYLNISDATTKCPEPLTLYDASGKKLCGPTNTDSIKCDSLTFHTHHIPYNFVCGKAVAYGYYAPCAFHYSTTTGYNTIMIPTSVDCPSLTRSEVSVNTSGATLQGIVSLFPAQATAHVLVIQVGLLLRSLMLTFTVSLALTQHQPAAGTPPTHSGMAKAATVVASAAIPVVHHGFSRPCLRRLHLILKFTGVSRVGGAPVTKPALNNLKFMSFDFTILCCLSCLVCSGLYT